MLAVLAEFEWEILSERVNAGIAQTRPKGKALGRPVSVANKAAEGRSLYRKDQLTKSEIARNLGISRTSVRRFLQMSR
jgi:DNA invertase Pin-like site-specific DNA recombinase